MPKPRPRSPSRPDASFSRDPRTGKFVAKIWRTENPRLMRSPVMEDVLDQARRVFGSAEKAKRWLGRPHAALDNKTPLELLANEDGAAARIRDMLLRIDHGIIG